MIDSKIQRLKFEIINNSLRNTPCLRERIGVVSSGINEINAPVLNFMFFRIVLYGTINIICDMENRIS